MKNKSFWKSPRSRLTILIVLIAVTAALILTLLLSRKTGVTDSLKEDTPLVKDRAITIQHPEAQLDNLIDSLLYTFGIKKEWITTEKKKAGIKADWFSKTVLIPKDLTSAEVNLDINSVLNEAALDSKVTEDIITKDITINVTNPDSTKTLPAAIIQISHSDKVKRESGSISIILDKVSEFSAEELDKLIITKSEFSYIFPRNLDDIEVQHKLLKNKKDVVINLTIGGGDSYESDFTSAMDDKAINERVRSFTADFSSVNKVLLTKLAGETVQNSLIAKIISALTKYNLTVISDSMITQAYNSNEKDRIGNFFNTIIQKASLNKNVIAIMPVVKAGFEDFYNMVLVYKKLGYRFLNLTDYFNYTKDLQKEQQEKDEKIKQEQVKKKKQEEVKKKPVDKKATPKKDVKKKTEKKKK